MKIYIEEAGSVLVRSAINEARLAATSLVAYVEARAAFARRRRLGDLSAAEHRRIVADFESDWARYWVVPATETLIREAADLADRYPLRGYDAVHLAAARLVAGERSETVTVATWDGELEYAATREGLASLRARR